MFSDKKENEDKKTEDEISIDDFAKVKFKVGTVLESKRVDGADKLLVSKIKIGDEIRQIVSGIAKFYSPEEIVGKKVIVVTNLKKVKIRGVESEGMILCAADKKHLSILTPENGDIKDGTSVS